MSFNPEEENAGADDPQGLGKQLTYRENADGVLELVEEDAVDEEPLIDQEIKENGFELADDPDDDDFDWDSIPQGKPEGQRVGGDAERTTQTCTTCKGVGSYPVKSFTEPDEHGAREVVVSDQFCVVCNGTGTEQVLR
ncbi:hypothetical protein HOT31_gp023 [Microbacterium phage Hendrix]|uniref:Uncharacterized protein n=1 Tax=Microbacterium phage Hendrix TaxID=2182341 RepID=A0A2U8UU57_9CAUD|nr:hypothetical protein HOT31_gp023 [Microbacterium phage Hendrix]AWN07694.1 hypothetical protein PBI_HENDRIX_23 [Microbacterium phage Hendrix]